MVNLCQRLNRHRILLRQRRKFPARKQFLVERPLSLAVQSRLIS